MNRSPVQDPWSTLSCNQGALDACAASLSEFLILPRSDDEPKRVVLIVGESGTGRSSFVQSLVCKIQCRASHQVMGEYFVSNPMGSNSSFESISQVGNSSHQVKVLSVDRHIGSNSLAMVDMICSLGAYPDVFRVYKRVGRSVSSVSRHLQRLLELQGYSALALLDLDSYAIKNSNVNKNDLALMLGLPSVRALMIELLHENVSWVKESLQEIDIKYQIVTLECMKKDEIFEDFVADIARLYGQDEFNSHDSELLSALYNRSKGRIGKLVELIRMELFKGQSAFEGAAPELSSCSAALVGESFSSWLWRTSQLPGYLDLKLAYDKLLLRQIETGYDMDFAFKEKWVEHLFEPVFLGIPRQSNTKGLNDQMCGGTRPNFFDAQICQGEGQCQENLPKSAAQVSQDPGVTPDGGVLGSWFECNPFNLRPLDADGRYCPRCLDEDIWRIGFPAWRIAWRRPNICVCDRHSVPVLLQRLYSPQANLMNRGWSAFVEYHDGPAPRLEVDFPLTIVSHQQCKIANAQLLGYALRVQRWIGTCDERKKEGRPSKAAVEFLLSFWLYLPGELKAVGFAQSFFFARQHHGKSAVAFPNRSEIRTGYEDASPRQVAVAFLMLGTAFDVFSQEEIAFISRTCRGHSLPFPMNREQLAASGQSGFIPTELDLLRNLAQEHLTLGDQAHVMWALRTIA